MKYFLNKMELGNTARAYNHMNFLIVAFLVFSVMVVMSLV